MYINKGITDVLFPMNLQLFAEGEAGGEPQIGAQVAQAATAPIENDGTLNAQTFKQADIQPQTFTQADVDRIVNQRLARQQRDEAKRIEQARAEGRSEAEKLAQMSESQRAEHERQRAEQAAQEREAAIARREADITRRELKAEAIDTLTKRGLPRGLEAVLDYASAEACSASIDAVEKVFREAVQAGVDERLRQSGVTLRSYTSSEAALNAQMRRAAGLPD